MCACEQNNAQVKDVNAAAVPAAAVPAETPVAAAAARMPGQPAQPVPQDKWFTYDIVAVDPKTQARAGVLHTPHGDIPTPIFMPVGTKSTVKGILPQTLEDMGTKILLNNTYHLSQRPGAQTVEEFGGVHEFMRWGGPILTDSGGFQVFSHEEFFKLSNDGVRFRAVDYDGSWVEWSPEKNMEIAQQLGADIVMQLDQCVGYPAPRSKVERSVELSSMWADRCFAAHTRPDQALFGIVQGGMHLDLRARSIRHLEEAGDFPGYGIGGYSVGEDHDTMFQSLEPLCAEYMPRHKPRYLMGVGNPTTLVRGVACGIDMFDCVLPTRTARTGTAFSSEGRLNLKHARFIHDHSVLDPACGCPTCRAGYTRGYLNHLARQKEMLGSILVSQHNIYYLLDLMRRARAAIIDGTYADFVDEWMASPAAKDW